MTPIPITNPQDPRIADYREVRERDLIGRQGRFVAEGEVVLRHLLGPRSRFACDSILVARNRLDALADAPGIGAATVYMADQAVMDAIVGFPIHRGLLGIGRVGDAASVGVAIGQPASHDVVLAIVGVGNHDNMGGLFRAAAGFGARAVLLDETCCDPLYRKAIRVSVGAALITPFARGGSGADLVEALVEAGYEPLALSPSAEMSLASFRPIGPTALVVGAEGPGLPESVMHRCRRIGIPMAPGFDSLNVATAGAIALHHLRSVQA